MQFDKIKIEIKDYVLEIDVTPDLIKKLMPRHQFGLSREQDVLFLKDFFLEAFQKALVSG